MNAIIAIALLAGVAVGGAVWFAWALAQRARVSAGKPLAPKSPDLPNTPYTTLSK